MLQILNLGAGVQSTTLLLMSCRGDLPKLDAAIFADTQWEMPATYKHLEWLTDYARQHNIPVHRVTAGNLHDSIVYDFVCGSESHKRYASIPLYTRGTTKGRLMRQCSQEYKIEPVERFIRRTLLGLPPGRRASANSVEQWFGMSSDELRRIRLSKRAWTRFIYPLCGLPTSMLPKPMSRLMCYDWLRRNYPDRIIPRSACIGCPFRGNREWQAVKADPVAWANAIDTDRAIRKPAQLDSEAFLHRSCVPLEAANLDEEQAEMWTEECLGVCNC